MAGDTRENRSNPGPSVAGVLHLGSVLGKGRHEVWVQAEGAQALSSAEEAAGGQSEAWGSAERSLAHHSLRVNLLADERALGNGLQGTDAPAHLSSPVELQPHPRGGEGAC